MLISIPLKYAVSQIIGFIKGKSAIYIARNFTAQKMNFGGQKFLARGYYVSTAGHDEQVVRNYIKDQGFCMRLFLNFHNHILTLYIV